MRLDAMKRADVVRRPGSWSVLGAVLAAGVLLPMAGWSQSSGAPVSFANPLPGERVTSRFGERVDPFSAARVTHTGVDVHGKPTSRVRAAASGIIEVATARYGGDDRHGTVVVVDHGRRLKTFYSHLDLLAVTAGDRVGKGDLLGIPGTTGRVTGRHLHFEVWENGTPVDPARFVEDWREPSAQ